MSFISHDKEMLMEQIFLFYLHFCNDWHIYIYIFVCVCVCVCVCVWVFCVFVCLCVITLNFSILGTRFQIFHFITTSKLCILCYVTLRNECNKNSTALFGHLLELSNIYCEKYKTNIFPNLIGYIGIVTIYIYIYIYHLCRRF